MRRFASFFFLVVIFVPSCFAHLAQAASPEDIQDIVNRIAAKAASGRVLAYHSDGHTGKGVGVEFVHEKRRYTLYHHPYGTRVPFAELPREKQQFAVLVRDDTPGFDNAAYILDTGLSGTQVMYVDMVRTPRGAIQSRGTKLSEQEKQERYDQVIKAVIAFYGQK